MSARTLIVGHSQCKYFDQYLSDIHTDVLCYPGYKVEELLLEPDVVNYIPAVSVSSFLSELVQIKLFDTMSTMISSTTFLYPTNREFSR